MESYLQYIALIISILGLLILTYAANVLEPPITKIGNVNQNSLGSNVRVQGEITDVHKFTGGSAVIKVKDETGIIDVYLPFRVASEMKTNLTEGKNADVIGSVEVYEGKLEIVVEEAGNMRVK